MVLRINLQNGLVRSIALVVTVTILLLILKIILEAFIVATLPETDSDKSVLAQAAEYYSNSPRLLARLAESEIQGPKSDLESAEKHALQAINLSPFNYNLRLLLAQIKDARGDRTGAEHSLRKALMLAPNYANVHWQMANLLVRTGRTEESIEHFQFATEMNPALLPASLDLVWAVSNQNVAFLNTIVKDNPNAQLKLARFLASQSRMPEAVAAFNSADKTLALSSTDSAAFFDALINKGFPRLANELWNKTNGVEGENPALVWNGDFENEGNDKLKHFDWRINKSNYARVGIDNTKARSGKQALLVNFAGRDTTKLDNEVNHLVALSQGVSYRLEFYVLTENLRTPEGPKVVISDNAGNWVAQSEPISEESKDWKRMSINFTAPQKVIGDGPVNFISVKRKPRFVYDDPTKGKIWFDDFSISEARGK